MRGMLSILSGVLAIIAFFPYIRAMVRGTTHPTKATWIIWGTLDSITFAGMIVAGTANGQIAAAAIGCWIVAILAFRYGVPGWTALDRWCLAGALLGIVLWVVTKSPGAAILTSMSIAFIGSIPTFVSAYQHPEREDRVTWALNGLGCVCSIAAIPAFTIEAATQPIMFFVITATIVFLIFVRPWHAVRYISPEDASV